MAHFMYSKGAVTPAEVSMNYTWIAGRLLLPAFIIVATIATMGSMRSGPTPLIKTTQESYQSSQSDSKAIGKAEDLVKDWKNPDFVLFITGRQHGYIEPCGCITLERQKGGLMRRHAVQKILKDRGWPIVSIDAGNQIKRTGQQPAIKLGRTYEALWNEMQYDSIGLGPDDLKLSAVDVAQKMINFRRDADPKLGIKAKNPFTCANTSVHGMNEPFQIIQRNGKRIGVTMILGDEYLAKIKQPGVATKAAAMALGPVVNAMNKAKCDVKVLVAFTNLTACRDLAKKFPFDVLVTAGGAGDPTLHPEVIQGPMHQTSMVQVGVKGMYVGLIGFFSDPKKPSMVYKRVELDHRYKDTKEIKGVFKAYQNDLKTLWKLGKLDDIRPRKHPSGHKFVGSETCNECHSDEFEIWEDGVDGNGGPHAEATDDLEENPNDNRVWVQRDYDPECMSCHAVGWNPQNYYPYETGLVDPENAKMEHLRGNGCENCHGPGSAHVEMEKRVAKGLVKKDAKKRKALLSEVRVTVAESRAGACRECHDLDNSPDFAKDADGFDKYWPKIEHGGDD